VVDLGHVDLLVQEGFYANRTDFIRTVIRNQIGAHADAVRRTVARKTLVLGLQHYTRRDLEEVRAAGETLQIKVLGLASIADDVPPELPWGPSTPSSYRVPSGRVRPSRRRWRRGFGRRDAKRRVCL
jgi:Arc/MetJ-type ribon-helix-helix transcriptional regulator